MAQFCTRCGKPLQPKVNFCPFCSGAVASPLPPQNSSAVRLTQEGGVLTRVEPQDVQYPMIVNDQRVDLQAIHLTGSMAVVDNGSQPAARSVGEIFVLDDPADPLVLNFRLKNPLYHNGNFRVEVVKIIFPVAKPENVLEKQLIQEKRAVTYGIYFDFNEETLKPESEPVLKEIAQAMTDGGRLYRQHWRRYLQPGSFKTSRGIFETSPGKCSTTSLATVCSPAAMAHRVRWRPMTHSKVARNRRVELMRE
jgi:hypothetical protein